MCVRELTLNGSAAPTLSRESLTLGSLKTKPSLHLWPSVLSVVTVLVLKSRPSNLTPTLLLSTLTSKLSLAFQNSADLS